MLINLWHKLENGRRAFVQVEVTEHSSELLSALTGDDSEATIVDLSEFSMSDLAAVESDAVTRYEERKREKL